MDDPDLAAIRAARMRELRGGGGGGGGGGGEASGSGLPAGLSLGGGGGGGRGGGAQDEEAQARQQEQMDEQKRQLLSTVLDAQARERRECSSLWTLALAARQARHVNVPAALLTLACPV
jgi:programmed cell death protein 5